MQTYIALLRAVNVANKHIQMDSLRELCFSLGAETPRTYLQSGNVIFAHCDPPDAVRDAMQSALERSLGVRTEVIVRTQQELDATRAQSPFVGRALDPSHLHVTFLKELPDLALVRALEHSSFGIDEFHVRARELYLYCPSGYARTKLNNAFFERRLATVATTRNWRTVLKLAELAAG